MLRQQPAESRMLGHDQMQERVQPVAYNNALVQSTAVPPYELAEMKGSVKTKPEELEELDAEYERLQETIKALEIRQAYLRSDIEVDKWNKSKLGTVPVEIISIIFEHYVDSDANANPWVLMQINRSWRQVAIHTRRIWSKIMIENKLPLATGRPRRYGGYEICVGKEWLRSALARAAGGPLDIMICRIPDHSALPERSSEPVVREMIDLLRTSRAYLRIRSLEVVSIDQIKAENFDEFLFPQLESAKLIEGTGLNERVQESAEKLKTLEIRQQFNPELDCNLCKLRSLQNLTLIGDSRRSLDGEKVYRKFLTSPPLVYLKLEYINIPPSGRTNLVSIPTLQTLILDSCNIEISFDLPNLETMRMSVSVVAMSDEEPLVLPLLNSLMIMGTRLRDCLHIRAPSVQGLEIGYFSSRGTSDLNDTPMCLFTRQVIRPGHIAPKSLRLTSINIDSKLLATHLSEMDFLEELYIDEGIPLTKVFFEAFAGCSLPMKLRARPNPICKSLRVFKLAISRYNHSATRDAMEKWVKEAIRARMKGPLPLLEALMRNGYSLKWCDILNGEDV